MRTHDDKYLEFIMHDKNLLLLSDNNFCEYNTIFDLFRTFIVNKIEEETFMHTDAILMQEQPDIVVLNCYTNKELVLKTIDKIYNFNDKITIIIVLSSMNFERHIDTINKVDYVLSEPFTRNDLVKKLSSSLNESTCIRTPIKVLSDTGEKIEDVEIFLDTFEGEVLFLNEELKDCVIQFDNGELSHNLLNEVAEKMKEVSIVFSRHNYTKKVSPIFTHLASYLALLELHKVDVENIEGFVFLARIIDDIQTYLFEYFVSRIFVDVYVFEDSLKNSIKFMQDRLKSKDNSNDKSELNFF